MDMINLKTGMRAEIEAVVLKENTAEAVGSGSIAVFATPSMIMLMEKAALTAVENGLPEGFTTVGTFLNVSHTAATPVGMKVRAVAELVGIEERKLLFRVEAFDEVEKIGGGSHERYIVNTEKFLSKVYAKGTKK